MNAKASRQPEDELHKVGAAWRLVRLGQIGRFSASGIDKLSSAAEIPVEMVNYTDVYGNVAARIDRSVPFMTTTTSAGKAAEHSLHLGDVLFTPSSETAGDIGWAAAVTEDLPDVVYSYHLTRWRPNEDFEVGFLRYALNSAVVRAQLTRAAKGTTRQILTRDDFRRVRIAIPSRRVQRALADYLDAETARIDAIVTARQRAADLAALRLDVLTRQVVSTDLAGQPYPIVPLRRRWQVIDCKHRTPSYEPEGYPIVSPGDATPGRLDLSRCTRFVGQADFEDLAEGARRPGRGDIIYTRNASIGIASYVDTDQPFSMGQDVCLLRSVVQDQRYLTYVLNTLGMDQLEEQKIGSTFSRINVARVLGLLVPCPRPAEQREIADLLDDATARTSTLLARTRQQIDLLLERRHALITATVAGRLEIPGVAA